MKKWVKFIFFLEIWEYAICIIDLGGWTSLHVRKCLHIWAYIAAYRVLGRRNDI